MTSKYSSDMDDSSDSDYSSSDSDAYVAPPRPTRTTINNTNNNTNSNNNNTTTSSSTDAKQVANGIYQHNDKISSEHLDSLETYYNNMNRFQDPLKIPTTQSINQDLVVIYEEEEENNNRNNNRKSNHRNLNIKPKKTSQIIEQFIIESDELKEIYKSRRIADVLYSYTGQRESVLRMALYQAIKMKDELKIQTILLDYMTILESRFTTKAHVVTDTDEHSFQFQLSYALLTLIDPMDFITWKKIIPIMKDLSSFSTQPECQSRNTLCAVLAYILSQASISTSVEDSYFHYNTRFERFTFIPYRFETSMDYSQSKEIGIEDGVQLNAKNLELAQKFITALHHPNPVQQLEAAVWALQLIEREEGDIKIEQEFNEELRAEISRSKLKESSYILRHKCAQQIIKRKEWNNLPIKFNTLTLGYSADLAGCFTSKRQLDVKSDSLLMWLMICIYNIYVKKIVDTYHSSEEMTSFGFDHIFNLYHITTQHCLGKYHEAGIPSKKQNPQESRFENTRIKSFAFLQALQFVVLFDQHPDLNINSYPKGGKRPGLDIRIDQYIKKVEHKLTFLDEQILKLSSQFISILARYRELRYESNQKELEKYNVAIMDLCCTYWIEFQMKELMSDISHSIVPLQPPHQNIILFFPYEYVNPSLLYATTWRNSRIRIEHVKSYNTPNGRHQELIAYIKNKYPDTDNWRLLRRNGAEVYKKKSNPLNQDKGMIKKHRITKLDKKRKHNAIAIQQSKIQQQKEPSRFAPFRNVVRPDVNMEDDQVSQTQLVIGNCFSSSSSNLNSVTATQNRSQSQSQTQLIEQESEPEQDYTTEHEFLSKKVKSMERQLELNQELIKQLYAQIQQQNTMSDDNHSHNTHNTHFLSPLPLHFHASNDTMIQTSQIMFDRSSTNNSTISEVGSESLETIRSYLQSFSISKQKVKVTPQSESVFKGISDFVNNLPTFERNVYSPLIPIRSLPIFQFYTQSMKTLTVNNLPTFNCNLWFYKSKPADAISIYTYPVIHAQEGDALQLMVTNQEQDKKLKLSLKSGSSEHLSICEKQEMALQKLLMDDTNNTESGCYTTYCTYFFSNIILQEKMDNDIATRLPAGNVIFELNEWHDVYDTPSDNKDSFEINGFTSLSTVETPLVCRILYFWMICLCLPELKISLSQFLWKFESEEEEEEQSKEVILMLDRNIKISELKSPNYLFYSCKTDNVKSTELKKQIIDIAIRLYQEGKIQKIWNRVKSKWDIAKVTTILNQCGFKSGPFANTFMLYHDMMNRVKIHLDGAKETFTIDDFNTIPFEINHELSAEQHRMDLEEEETNNNTFYPDLILNSLPPSTLKFSQENDPTQQFEIL